MGTFEVTIPAHPGRMTRAEAIRRARQVAVEDHISVRGNPTVRVKHKLLPVIGPRRAFVVTFPRASRGTMPGPFD